MKMEKKDDEEFYQVMSKWMIEFNKMLLKNKPHIKKYNKLRILHSRILDHMEEYMFTGKYSIRDNYLKISNEIFKETNGLDFKLNFNDDKDLIVLDELFCYDNHKNIPNLTDIYLDKKIFRSEDKIKMLKAMKNSYVGLFRVLKVDSDNGYVYYQDVFTHKKFKIIDIALSSTFKNDSSKKYYVYNRVITFDDISFGTGIHIIMTGDNKYLNEFLKKHKYNECSDFSRCLMLYDITKRDKSKVIYYCYK